MRKLLLLLPLLFAGCSVEHWEDFHKEAEAYRLKHAGAPVAGQDEVVIPTPEPANPYQSRFDDWSASS